MTNRDFFFYNGWEAARQNGEAYVLSKFHTLPREGGWNDQDWFEKEDLLEYLRGYTWAWHQNHPDEGHRNPSEDASNPLNFQRDGAISDIDDFVN